MQVAPPRMPISPPIRSTTNQHNPIESDMKSTTSILSALLLLAMLAPEITGQTFDRSFPDTDVGVNTLGVADATTLYVGGLFENLVVRDGVGITVSTTGTQISSRQYGNKVHAAIPDNAGGFYVAGEFTYVDDSLRSRIVRITSSGGIDGSFRPVDINGPVRALLLAGGNLYVGGEFTSINGNTRNRLARLNPTTGALDGAFTIGVTGTTKPKVLTIEAQSDASAIYIGGDFNTVGIAARNNIAKINITPTIAVDGTFTTGTDSSVYIIRISANDSKLFIGGEFGMVGTKTREHIAKVEESSGVGVNGWNPGASAAVYDIERIPNGIIVCGAFLQIDGKNRNRMAKLETDDGAARSGFSIPGAVDNTIYSITDDGTGDWYVAGAFTVLDNSTRKFLAKVDGTGDVQPWNPGSALWTEMRTVAFDPGFPSSGIFCGGRDDFFYTSPHIGKVVGTTVYYPEVSTNTPPYPTGFAFRSVSGFNRALAVGPDATFGGNSTNRDDFAEWVVGGNITSPQFRPVFGTGGKFWNIAMSGSTAIVVGEFTQIERHNGSGWDTVTRGNMAAVDLSTSPITFTALDPNANGVIYDVVISGSIAYVAGTFTQIGGVSRAGLAAVDLTTGNVTSWNPNPSPSGTVNAIAVDGSNIFLGGSFTSAGGASRSNVACVDNVNGAATSWNPGTNGTVYALAVDGSNLYLGGSFTTTGGVARNRAAVLGTSTATVDANWNPNCNNAVFDIAIFNNKVVLAGSYTTIMSRERRGLAAVSRAAGGAPKSVHRERAIAGSSTTASLEATPNPTRDGAAITFRPRHDGMATITLYSSIGVEARRLFNGEVESGEEYTVSFDRGDLPAGVYLVRMMNEGEQVVRRVVVVE